MPPSRWCSSMKLADQPLMRTVLADLALESEAAVAAVMRLCRSYDLAGDGSEARRRARGCSRR